MASREDLIINAETLEHMLMARATGGGGTSDAAAYAALRQEFLGIFDLAPLVPRFVKTCRDLGAFWAFIKEKFSTYDERRKFLRAEFAPLRDALEGRASAPSDPSVSGLLRATGVAYIHETWNKALGRREQDPDGAITSARTLLETVCKAILDDAQVGYRPADDLPALYGKVARVLRLAPGQHSQEVFRRILGGCHSVIEGLGALRNQMGDAHGRTHGVTADPRHAALAVNLAGAMAAFLWETAQARR